MKRYISIILATFLVLSVHAQSADILGDILESEEATYGQVCYLAAVEQGLIPENADFEMAVVALADIGQIPSVVDANVPVPYVDAIFIMSHMWKIKGGVMYKITGGSPRYTFRQFKYDAVIPQNIQSTDCMSGRDLLTLYTTAVKVYGGFDINKVSMEDE